MDEKVLRILFLNRFFILFFWLKFGGSDPENREILVNLRFAEFLTKTFLKI